MCYNNSMKPWAKQSGFTIVELLIVIVVIGILAAITIVAYNGIQTRAENTKTINAVASYAKGIMSYAATYGTYPITAGYPCLGSASLCARVAGGAGGCAATSDGSVGQVPAFNTDISQIMGPSLPSPSSQTMVCGTNTYSGAYYRPSTGTQAWIVFYLRGNQQCEVAGVTVSARNQQDDMTRCQITFPLL